MAPLASQVPSALQKVFIFSRGSVEIIKNQITRLYISNSLFYLTYKVFVMGKCPVLNKARDTLETYGTPDAQKGTSRSTKELAGTPKNFLEFSGIPRNLSNSMKYKNTLNVPPAKISTLFELT